MPLNYNFTEVTIPPSVTDKLIKSGDGKACLYYLCSLATGNGTFKDIAGILGWSEAEAAAAYTSLEICGLYKPEAKPTQKTVMNKPAVGDDSPPVYTGDDISLILREDKTFKSLVEYTKTRLNKILTSSDLSRLLVIYDHLGMTANIIMLLISYCASREMRVRGEGAKLRMWQVEREAFYWMRNGITTESAAEEYIRKTESESRRFEGIMRLLQIRGRLPTESEEKYLHKWVGYGIGDDVIYAAYDKTVINTGGLKWGYMDKILADWVEKGITNDYKNSSYSERGQASNMPANKKEAANSGTVNSGIKPENNAAERLKRRRAAQIPPYNGESQNGTEN